MRTALLTLAAVALILAGCSTVSNGTNPAFAQPAYATEANLIRVQAADLAGHKVEITDEEGPFWIKFAKDGTMSAGMPGRTDVPKGAWSIDGQGRLHLESDKWWRHPQNFAFYGTGGTSARAATVVHPDTVQHDNGPNTYFPFRFLD